MPFHSKKNKLVTYDTTDDTDTTHGVQLGCNGIVHILFEPIHPEQPDNPIELLKRITAKRQNAVLITLFSLHARTGEQPRTCYLDQDQVVIRTKLSEADSRIVHEQVNTAKARQDSFFKEFHFDSRKSTGFIEYLKTPPALIIAGAGNDTIPLMEMAHTLGWDVTVVDGRSGHATRQRFPKAKNVFAVKSDEVLNYIKPDSQTFFVLMTHNYNYELSLLKQLIELDDCMYIGTLGPKKSWSACSMT